MTRVELSKRFAVASAAVVNALGRVPLLREALRRSAHAYREGSVVKLRVGHGAGLSWCRHHRYVNGYWLGNYELPVQEALHRLLRRDDVFYDVGANAGFFTLLASRFVGPRGRVYAFEPVPDSIGSIRDQIRVNSLANVTVVEKAVDRVAGSAAFSYDPAVNAVAHLGGPASGERQLVVETTTLDDFAAAAGFPHALKLDVEGAEVSVLEGAARVLESRPRWLIELHGLEQGRGVVDILRKHDYTFETLSGSNAAAPEREPHLVAIPR